MSIEEARDRIDRYRPWTKSEWNDAVATFVLEVQAEMPCYRQWATGAINLKIYTEVGQCQCPACAARAELAKRKAAV